ncbi:MAG: DUF1636 domain-containing protein [Rhodobacteraceae bacterium]|nr:DUF1636 domain-containing protein [Paracoccaceae bacterium]
MTTWITVCDTCKRSETGAVDAEGTDGERLAALVERAAAGRVQVRRFSCLMGCARACNVTIQATGKIGYTLAEFQPTREDAAAIADYAEMHQESDNGQVPYRQWPQGVKGHFATRHPALPDLAP